MIRKSRRLIDSFSVCGFLLIAAFLAVVNYLTSASYPWSVYPVLALVWWPLAVIVPRRFGAKVFSVCGCALLLVTLAAINFLTTPSYPWFLYPAFAALWWPLAVIAPRKFGSAVFSICGCVLIVAFLALLNYLTSPFYPWFLYPAFAALWWPLAVIVPKKFGAAGFSICGFILLTAFFAAVNYFNLAYSSPRLWFLYPAFAALWWPFSVIVPRKFGAKVYSVCGSLLLIGFLITINCLYTPSYPWMLFALAPILLWPVCMLTGERAGRLSTAVFLSTLTALYYIALNLFFTHGFPWCMFVIYALLWWPLSLLFSRKKKSALPFSVTATALTCVMLFILNMVTTPHVIWFVYPVFGLLWWPLSVYFFIYKKKKSRESRRNLP